MTLAKASRIFTLYLTLLNLVFYLIDTEVNEQLRETLKVSFSKLYIVSQNIDQYKIIHVV